MDRRAWRAAVHGGAESWTRRSVHMRTQHFYIVCSYRSSVPFLQTVNNTLTEEKKNIKHA